MTRGQSWATDRRDQDRSKKGRESRKRSALIVEDDDRVRELMAMLMRSEGFDTIELADGIEALSYLAASEIYRTDLTMPDLIVADINMPTFSGLDLLMGMRGSRVRPPVMLVTGERDEEVCRAGRRLGAVCVVRKPFDVGVFLDAVDLCLAQPKRVFDTEVFDLDS
ncbi:hypothetical protein BH23ACT4_BH23ACT4_15430 [soil metagenome]